ncbi:DUF4013 domain-containing protein [Lysobacter sp. A03]|uniref:DUF4013 domain-containing protein n=1 Tax=Lysobacter sp. A03 TaxID=1199154 RepID=UPI0005B6EE36|nr:DUF4013 domain-containing protein [Lysobacter sp. A03]KIQ98373.1 hypothetical protein TI01_0017 [Lysobacter sp. A03]
MQISPSAAPVPFWQRLRAITSYPLRGAAFSSLLALTLTSLLGLIPVIGLVFTIVVWIGAYKYAFEILRTTADGRMEAPEVVLGTDNGVVIRLIAMQLIFIAVLLLATVVGGPVTGLATIVLIAFLQPGCIMSLAMDGSLPHALNPATPLTLVSRIGWPYMAVFALLFVIQASMFTATVWLAEVMPPVVADLMVSAVSFWALFAAFHLMGYLVYQYHEVLGYVPTGTESLPGRRSPDTDLLAEAEGYVRDGQLDTALELLRGEIRSRAVGLETHGLYRRLLQQVGNAAGLSEHAREYLNVLVMEKHDRRAIGLLRESLDADSDFVPMHVPMAEQLIERARLSGQKQLALDARLALLRAHPRDPSAPGWALENALQLLERGDRDQEARALLAQARERCEDEILQAKIDAATKLLPDPLEAPAQA